MHRTDYRRPLLHLALFSIAVACAPTPQICAETSDCPLAHICVQGACQSIEGFDGGTDGGTLNALDGGSDAGSVNQSPIVGLEIAPGSSRLVSVDGAAVSVDFAANLLHADGSHDDDVVALWSAASLALGSIDPVSGVFTATGLQGGTVEVTAVVTAMGITVTDTAIVSVDLQRVTLGSGVPVDAAQKFGTIEPYTVGQSAALLYPLDHAVMPQNVFPPDLQWDLGEAGDLYRIRLAKPGAELTTYALHSGTGFANHWQLSEAEWKPFVQTSPGIEGTITVDRWVASSQRAFGGQSVHVKIAPVALSGSVYYWAVSEGRVVRVDDGTNQQVNFMPTPPEVNGPGGRGNCVGCHTVSPSGRYMAGRMGGGDNYGTVFDLTQNLAQTPVPSLFPTTMTRWWFSAWNPSETRLITTRGSSPTGLGLIDPFSGQPVPALGAGLPANHVTQPSWAPDNSALAYVSNVSDWGGDFTSGDLTIQPITGPDTFGPEQIVLAGAAVPLREPMHSALSYPVWTPDSKKLVFAHGASARSSAAAQLYITNRDGTDVHRLAKANGGQLLSYEPRFSPFASGDYFWLAFLSRRDYGNAQVGTQGMNRPQIWVTAIKKNVAAGEDPSEVAFWLPGQSTQSSNISAYWAQKACRATGSECGVDSECCSGECRVPTGGGATVCSPPPPDRCRIAGQTCSSASDCCTSLTCSNNVCSVDFN